MQKYQSQGKMSVVKVFNKNKTRYLQKEYGHGAGLTKKEAQMILDYHRQYLKNLSRLPFETNLPTQACVVKNGAEYLLITQERLRGTKADLHHQLLGSKSKSQILSRLALYHRLSIKNLFRIPPLERDKYSTDNLYVSVPMDYRLSNFVIENKKQKKVIVNVDSFAPKLWRSKGKMLYLPKIEDGFPAIKARLAHLLMGNMRYLYGCLYGTAMLIVTQWGKEHLKDQSEVELLRARAAKIMQQVGREEITKAGLLDKDLRKLLINDVAEVINKTVAESPYDGTQVIIDFWTKLDKGVLRSLR